MRISVFDDVPEGGAKRVVFEQVKGLAARHRVDYFTNEVVSHFPFEDYAHEVFRYPLCLPSFKGGLRPLRELAYLTSIVPTYRAIARQMKTAGSEMVIVHPSRLTQAPGLLQQLTIPSLYFAEEWPRIVYEPLLHPLPLGRLRRMYEAMRRKWIARADRRAAESASLITATSRYMKAALERIYDKPIQLLPLGVDCEVFYPTVKQADEKPYFLFIGEPTAINGYPLVAPLLNRFNVKLITFKRGEFRYSDAKLRRLYAGATATLCVAVNEPFGLAALESMACETPVIAVAGGGYRDTVKPDKGGLLIKAKTSLLAGAMQRLADDDSLRQRLGKTGRDWVMQRFSWERHVLQLETYMDEVRYG